jgi:hypothetical protein
MIWSEGSPHGSQTKNVNSQHHNLLVNQIFPNRGIFYFGGHFGFKMAAIANQNGRHMVQHVLLPVNIHFHWNLLIFEFLAIYFYFFYFYIGGHFENFKNKDHNFEWWSNFVSSFKQFLNILCTFVTMAMAAFLNCFNLPKAATHYDGYSYKVSWSLMKGIQFFF